MTNNYICTCSADDMHINIVNKASNTCGADIQWSNIFLIINFVAHFALLIYRSISSEYNNKQQNFLLEKKITINDE